MKRIQYILLSILFMFIFQSNVYASSDKIKSSSSSMYRGETVTISATVSAGSGIYTVAGSVYCSGAGVGNGIDLTFEDLNTANKSLYCPHQLGICP